jgi:oligoendopeptidase F
MQGHVPSRDRAAIPRQYIWDLADLFPDLEAWRLEKDRLASELAAIRQFQGTLATSADALAQALEARSILERRLVRLGVYASLLADQDTRVPLHQGMQQEIQHLAAVLGADGAYIEPEVLRIDRATLEGFLAAEPRLAPYTFYLHDLMRRAAHTLSDAEEKILAAAAPLASAPSDIYGILSNADFPYPTVTLSDNRTVRVDHAGYSEVRASSHRDDRQRGMAAFLEALGAFNSTFGVTLNADAQKMLFLAKSRHYASSLEMALNGPNIPVSVYTRLIDGVNRNLPSFHRYLGLRKRMLGVPELHYFDLYAPLVAAVDREYSPEEAQAHLLAALAPLGPDYVRVVRRSFAERWIDLLPNDGKRSGAYSEGVVYDVHPYMLLNYLGRYNDVSTLAHELGHTMHSYYSNATQPYPTAGYETFVAEVASTLNEELLVDYMLRRIEDIPTRMAILGEYVEHIKSTVFRQTQFAEFELRMHEMAQRGEPLTGAALSALYLDITKKYYGHEHGICVVDDYIAYEWSFIPHFYRNFYVFTYATSFTASAALATKIVTGDPEAQARYLTLLRSGGSQYPVELLKAAGVDMTTDEPLTLTVEKMERVMDDMEQLLDGR